MVITNRCLHRGVNMLVIKNLSAHCSRPYFDFFKQQRD